MKTNQITLKDSCFGDEQAVPMPREVFQGFIHGGEDMDKKTKWSPEARQRHLEGCRRWQRELAARKVWDEFIKSARTFAKRNNFTLYQVIEAMKETILHFKGKKKMQPEEVEKYFHNLLRQNTSEA